MTLSLICGYVGRAESTAERRATNSAAVLAGGQVVFRQKKMLLPTYDVFDEARYFLPGRRQRIVTIGRQAHRPHHLRGRLERQAVLGAPRCTGATRWRNWCSAGGELLISINASPYHMGKRALRREIFAATARRHTLPVVYVNQVGGNDQLVFDGSSFAMDAEGRVIASAASFAEDLVLVDTRHAAQGDLHENLADECEAVYEALVLGTRDYIRKCGFQARAARPERRHRFVAHRGDRRRRRGPRERDRRGACPDRTRRRAA